jgi:uncharacterized protein (DUF924 family)
VSADWRSDVLKFWFGVDPQQWWTTDPVFDHRIRQDFLKLWAEKRQLPVDAFLDDPLTALAAVILFDQLSRNMFRGHADQFATDHLALAIAKRAVDQGLDEQLQPIERNFLYMPFAHSENLNDQDSGLVLFSRAGSQNFIASSRKHRDLIDRFGRFPHRNTMLGRAPRPDEVAAGDVAPW